MGNSYSGSTVADLAQEISAVLARLKRRENSDNVTEMSIQARRISEFRAGIGSEFTQKISHVENCLEVVNLSRRKAHDALTSYAKPIFPAALSGTAKSAVVMSSIRNSLARDGVQPAVGEEHEDENRRILNAIRNAGTNTSSFRDRVRQWWEKLQSWLNRKFDGFSETLNRDEWQIRRWLQDHKKQIDAVFSGFAIASTLLIVPVLTASTLGTALPAWIGIQIGMAGAKCAWKIVKGDRKKGDRVDRFLIKKALVGLAADTVGIFTGMVPTECLRAKLAAELGGAAAKVAVGLVLGPGEGESTRKHAKRLLCDTAIESFGLFSEYAIEKVPDSSEVLEQSIKIGSAAATFAMRLVRGPDAGKNRAWHAIKQSFRSSVEFVGIFEKQILKHFELQDELDSVVTMWAEKDTASKLYEHAKPRASLAETLEQIKSASARGDRERWRNAQEGAVRSWLMDRGEHIEGSLLRVSTIARFYSADVTKIVVAVDGITGGIAVPVWVAAQLGVVGTNYAWRVMRGDSSGSITPQHQRVQLFWASVETLGLFRNVLEPDNRGYKTLRMVDDVRFMSQWIAYTRRYA